SLLSDGIGDTIRVSLTEDSVHEIPVARELIRLVPAAAQAGDVSNGKNEKNAIGASHSSPTSCNSHAFACDPFTYRRRATEPLSVHGVPVGGESVMRVVVRQASYDQVAHKLRQMGDYQPEIVYENAAVAEVDPRDQAALA